MILRTGVDIVEIQRLEQVNPAIRERFIRRVFTPLEIELARGSYASLAGRFAAKEAVSKALGTGIGPVSWQDIEIRRDASGAPVLYLHGRAAEVARLLGLTTWSVSISHGRTHAVAMAVALGEGRE
ncbi:holo-ACP synthase [Anaerolinea thermophila]|uniref:Holo-[acyl-carrier-protein] synthase n=1 Tax=Anaerolinea thermophila (strain DSM 14523 / JCM 11388 / NBRC 100420 / UNI-1) TaxID=926569 RepID=E8MZJ3_ANATU|nr:holo-ACP synthase [Anaerolinea thermophila]BAJ64541.1 holo-[acyl-carrier-protein] synthase [Anaerolinea thermophila UNI-1]